MWESNENKHCLFKRTFLTLIFHLLSAGWLKSLDCQC